MVIHERIKLMEDYLKLKVSERDWHGVADAAMDLRELEVELKFMDKQPEQSVGYLT